MILTKEQLYEIAKICDNEFNGSWETFKAITTKYGYYLTTNKCDYCSNVKVFCKDCKFDVHRIYEDCNGSVQYLTMEKIKQYLGLEKPIELPC